MAELSIGRKKAVARKSELERPSLAQVWELSYLIKPIPQIPTGLSRELKRFLDLPHQLDCWSSINTMEPGSSGLPLSGAEYNQFRHAAQRWSATLCNRVPPSRPGFGSILSAQVQCPDAYRYNATLDYECR